VPRASPSSNRPALSQGRVKPASAPHLEGENRGEAPFEMETACKGAVLPAVSCALLKAQVMFIPGLFAGAATWTEMGTRAQETLPRGSPGACESSLSHPMPQHRQDVEFL